MLSYSPASSGVRTWKRFVHKIGLAGCESASASPMNILSCIGIHCMYDVYLSETKCLIHEVSVAVFEVYKAEPQRLI